MNASVQSQSSRVSSKRKTHEKKVIYSARFVKENFGDRHTVKPSEVFIKSWTFRNNGETEWPADALFIQTNGDDLKAMSQIVNGTIVPGQEITISLEL